MISLEFKHEVTKILNAKSRRHKGNVEDYFKRKVAKELF